MKKMILVNITQLHDEEDIERARQNGELYHSDGQGWGLTKVDE